MIQSERLYNIEIISLIKQRENDIENIYKETERKMLDVTKKYFTNGIRVKAYCYEGQVMNVKNIEEIEIMIDKLDGKPCNKNIHVYSPKELIIID